MMRRAAAALAARASAAAVSTEAAAASSSSSSATRSAPPALFLLLQQQLGFSSSSSVAGPYFNSSNNKQQQQQAAPSSAAATTHHRSFASSTTTTTQDDANDPVAQRGRPAPHITDAQFTSETEQRQQRAHQAAALRASMDALVDGAVDAVEQGDLPKAVEVLERGLNVLASEHGQAPELGELHNQAALLLLLQSSGGGEGEEEDGSAEQQHHQNPLSRAAEHATQALRLTEKAFGAAHPLTGHRLLRLGTIRLAQGRASDAAPLLAAAADMLSGSGEGKGDNNNAQQQQGVGSGNTAFGPGLAEARFHLALLPVGAARQASAVAAAEDALASSLAELVSLLGPDSMIVRLALAQHSAAVGRGLEHAAVLMGGGGGGSGSSGNLSSTSTSGSAASLALSEALLKQHARLQEARDRGSAELGLARYQLAVLYYSHDLLHDAGSALRQAREVLASHIPQGHDVDQLMRHRAGMIAAAQGDARAGEQLLKASREHYEAQAREMMMGGVGGSADSSDVPESSSSPAPAHPLQREADFGLVLCKLRALETQGGGGGGGGDSASRFAAATALLDEAAAARRDVARALGASHLLSLGAARHEARARVMAQEKFGGGGGKKK